MPTFAPTGRPKCCASAGVIGPVIVKPSKLRNAAPRSARTCVGVPRRPKLGPPGLEIRRRWDEAFGAPLFRRCAPKKCISKARLSRSKRGRGPKSERRRTSPRRRRGAPRGRAPRRPPTAARCAGLLRRRRSRAPASRGTWRGAATAARTPQLLKWWPRAARPDVLAPWRRAVGVVTQGADGLLLMKRSTDCGCAQTRAQRARERETAM